MSKKITLDNWIGILDKSTQQIIFSISVMVHGQLVVKHLIMCDGDLTSEMYQTTVQLSDNICYKTELVKSIVYYHTLEYIKIIKEKT